MSITDKLQGLISEFPRTTPDTEELQRLSQFLIEMKRMGVAKTQEYNLPRPDTLGRRLMQISPRKSVSIQGHCMHSGHAQHDITK
ncbi:MAG: hypothetical protein AB1646_06930 [Thermodesulfobacteriota bacterium]